MAWFNASVWSAASTGDVDGLIAIVTLNPELIDSIHPFKRGRTPIYVAAVKGHVKIIEKLIELGSRHIDTPDRYGWTPMHAAVHHKHTSVIETLVRLGSKAIDTPDNCGATPMYEAVWGGHVSIIETLVRLGSNAIDTPCNDGCTPLYVAACFGRTNFVKTLKILGAKRPIIQKKGISRNALECLNVQVDEDESAALRSRVYFSRSLMERILFELEARRNQKTTKNTRTPFN